VISRFDDFLKILVKKAGDLAQEGLKEYRNEATKDARSFLLKAQDDLERWTDLLARGDLSREDFAWLLKGKEDLAELEALKRAGLGRARLQRFRQSLLDLVAATAFDVFL
jgi:hypothetical protein